MAAPRRRPVPVEDRRHGSPAEQLRRDLERFAVAGLIPERAWQIAFERIRWPHDTAQRKQWKAILENDRERWLAAYTGQVPEPSDEAAGQLVAA